MAKSPNLHFNKNLFEKLSFQIKKSDFAQFQHNVILHELDIAVQIATGDTTIDHHERLKRLDEISRLAKKEKIKSSEAYAFGIKSMVLQELGIYGDATKTANTATNLFNQIEKGLFSYSGLILCYSILGKSYTELGLSKIGLDQFEKALKILPKTGDQGIPAFRVYEGIAACYSQFGDSKKTFHYLEKCEKIIEENIQNPSNKLATKIPVLFKTAQEYRKLGNHRKCLSFLKKGEDAIKDHADDVIYQEQLQRELCITYSKMEKYDKAKSCLKNAIELNQHQRNDFKTLETRCLLGELLIKQDQLDDALKIFLSILDNVSNENLHLLADTHRNLAHIYREKNEFEKLSQHLGIYTKYLEKNYLEKHEILANNKEEAIERLTLELDVVRKEEENRRLQLEVDHKNRQLTSKALFSASNREFLESVVTRIDGVNQENQELNELKNIFEERLFQTTDWEEFEKRFNEVHPKFIQDLDKNDPPLSPAEIRVACLIKMGCDTHEIAHLLWVSNRGVEQHRYRIKKKLAIQENVTTYLLSL